MARGDCTRARFQRGTISPPFSPAALRRASSFWADARSRSAPTRTRYSLWPLFVASAMEALKPCDLRPATRCAAFSRLLKVPSCTIQPAALCPLLLSVAGACATAGGAVGVGVCVGRSAGVGVGVGVGVGATIAVRGEAAAAGGAGADADAGALDTGMRATGSLAGGTVVEAATGALFAWTDSPRSRV